MLKAILAVIVGYIAMVLVIILCFTGLQLGLGTERVFEPGTYNASMLFNSVALGVAFIAAVIGGIVAGAIAPRMGPAKVLAATVLVLGLLSGWSNFNKADPGPRAGDITPFEAASKAKQPNWYAFTIPILGAAGVLVGASLITRKK
jgi:MFS family permease